METKKKKSTKALILKPLLRFIILMLSMFLYLALGAYIFHLLEHDYNIKSQKRFYASLIEFMDDHRCVSNESLHDFFGEVNEAIRMSVVSTTRQSVIRDSSQLWNIATSFFFTSTVVTTIGYGNFAPTTDRGRIFCSFYAFFGIPLTGWFLLTVGDALQVYWVKIRHYTHRLTVKIPNQSARRCAHFTIYTTIIVIILLFIPGAIFTYVEGWEFHEAVYYCFITFSTIGFGDLVACEPKRHSVALWMLNVAHVIWLLIGLSIMSMALKGFGKSQKTNLKRAKTAVRNFAQKASLQKASIHKETTLT